MKSILFGLAILLIVAVYVQAEEPSPAHRGPHPPAPPPRLQKHDPARMHSSIDVSLPPRPTEADSD